MWSIVQVMIANFQAAHEKYFSIKKQAVKHVDLLQVDLHEKNKRRRTRASERERRSREREGGRLVKLAGFLFAFRAKNVE